MNFTPSRPPVALPTDPTPEFKIGDTHDCRFPSGGPLVKGTIAIRRRHAQAGGSAVMIVLLADKRRAEALGRPGAPFLELTQLFGGAPL